MAIPEPTAMSIEEAATYLGLHYMTVYRYVRIGRLPAHYRCGRWHIDVQDVESLKSDGRRSTGGRPPAGTPRGMPTADDAETAVSRFVDRLIAGDSQGAWAIVESSLMSGTAAEVYLRLIGPALRRVGDGWEAGRYSVADEHRATAVAAGLIGRLGPMFTRPGRKRPGAVLLAGAEGDSHSIPLTMVGDLLRADGFQVVQLGANVPAATLAEAARSLESLRLVGISVSTDRALAKVKRAVGALRKACPEVPVLVGGPAICSESEAKELGADGWAADGAGVVQLVRAGRQALVNSSGARSAGSARPSTAHRRD